MKRINIPNAETFVAAIQDEISRSVEGRYFHRLDVVLHVLQGASPYEAARLFGHSPRTVEYWLHRLLSGGLAGLWEGDRRDVQVACLPRIYRGYSKNSGAHPGIWDTTKTSGMGSYYHTIWQRSTPLRSVCGSARDCSINSDSVSRDHVESLAKLILRCRMPLKKLLPMEERPRCPALGRGRSPFPTAHEPDTDVGTQGTAAPCALPLVPRQSGLLRRTRPQNRETPHQRSSYLQRRNLWRFCPLSSSIHSRENLPHFGQCKMAQSASFEGAVPRESKPDSTHLSTTLFARIESGGTCLENHSQTSHPQPILRLEREFENIFACHLFSMGKTKQYAQNIMRKHLRRYI